MNIAIFIIVYEQNSMCMIIFVKDTNLLSMHIIKYLGKKK